MMKVSQAVKKVFFDGIHPEVAKLDFKKLRFKLVESSEASMSLKAFEEAENEYRRFLSLKKMYPSYDLVPTKQIDEFWHAHILDTKAYREDCQKIFGYFLEHYPYFGIHSDEDYEDLQQAFQHTCQLYEQHFGEAPKSKVSRCQGHACHVPGTCACRTPGACK